MNTYLQPSFFDVETRAAKLTEMGDPLVGLNAQIDWEAFRSDLRRVHDKARKNNAGAKPKDVVLMFVWDVPLGTSLHGYLGSQKQ